MSFFSCWRCFRICRERGESSASYRRREPRPPTPPRIHISEESSDGDNLLEANFPIVPVPEMSPRRSPILLWQLSPPRLEVPANSPNDEIVHLSAERLALVAGLDIPPNPAPIERWLVTQSTIEFPKLSSIPEGDTPKNMTSKLSEFQSGSAPYIGNLRALSKITRKMEGLPILAPARGSSRSTNSLAVMVSGGSRSSSSSFGDDGLIQGSVFFDEQGESSKDAEAAGPSADETIEKEDSGQGVNNSEVADRDTEQTTGDEVGQKEGTKNDATGQKEGIQTGQEEDVKDVTNQEENALKDEAEGAEKSQEEGDQKNGEQQSKTDGAEKAGDVPDKNDPYYDPIVAALTESQKAHLKLYKFDSSATLHSLGLEPLVDSTFTQKGSKRYFSFDEPRPTLDEFKTLSEEPKVVPSEKLEVLVEESEVPQQGSNPHLEELQEGLEVPQEHLEELQVGLEVPQEHLEELQEGLEVPQEHLEELQEGLEVPQEHLEELQEGLEIPQEHLEELQEGLEVPQEHLEELQEGLEVPQEHLEELQEGLEVPQEGVKPEVDVLPDESQPHLDDSDSKGLAEEPDTHHDDSHDSEIYVDRSEWLQQKPDHALEEPKMALEESEGQKLRDEDSEDYADRSEWLQNIEKPDAPQLKSTEEPDVDSATALGSYSGSSWGEEGLEGVPLVSETTLSIPDMSQQEEKLTVDDVTDVLKKAMGGVAKMDGPAEAHASSSNSSSSSSNDTVEIGGEIGGVDPPGGAADPPGGAADPPGGAADPPGGAADPPGGAADPPGGAADPPGGVADP